jgi:hypothetical protein
MEGSCIRVSERIDTENGIKIRLHCPNPTDTADTVGVETGGGGRGTLRKVTAGHMHGRKVCVDSFADSVIVSLLVKLLLDHESNGPIVDRNEAERFIWCGSF